jgi:hypothetical protein
MELDTSAKLSTSAEMEAGTRAAEKIVEGVEADT